MEETLDDLLGIFENLDGGVDFPSLFPSEEANRPTRRESQKPSSSSFSSRARDRPELDLEPCPKRNKRAAAGPASPEGADVDGEPRVSHVTVERNRRKQMNENLCVLRSLMPCFYVKRGDQASIIGGVVDYINELHQILQSLEAKKHRKAVSNEVLSPRRPPLSPRLNNAVPISPRTTLHQPGYKPATSSSSPSPSSSNNSSSNELVANSKSGIADVEVKFSGPNLLVRTVSPRIPGQALKIIAALEDLCLEILRLNISTVDDSLLVNSFTIKIGIECQLSAEELAHQIQQTFY